MALRLQRLDPDRRRRRLALLAQLTDALRSRRLRTEQRRNLIAARRRLAD